MNFEFYLNLEYKRITEKLSDELCSKIVNKAIRNFQAMKDCLAGEDSGLINVWNEIWLKYKENGRYFTMCILKLLNSISIKRLFQH